MKIENISSKVIGIGDVTVLPGETQEVPAEFENSIALEVYKSMGFITISGSAQEALSDHAEDEIRPVDTEVEDKKAKLESLKNASEEDVAKLANELGINPAECKDLADVKKKVKEALSK